MNHENTRIRFYEAGDYLVKENECGTEMFLILAGEVTVQLRDTCIVIGVGEIVGEDAVLTAEPRKASVSANTRTKVMCISKDEFAAELEASSYLVIKPVLRHILMRMQNAETKLRLLQEAHCQT